MLARVAAAVVCIVSQQAFAEAGSLVGSWYSDDGRTYYEVHFRRDHTFSLFARISMRNPELAVAGMGEQFGTWRVAGDRIVLDSTARGSKERSHVNLRFRLADRFLSLQRFYDATHVDTYHRLGLPQPLAVVKSTFDFMKEFREFATLAPASGGSAQSR